MTVIAIMCPFLLETLKRYKNYVKRDGLVFKKFKDQTCNITIKKKRVATVVESFLLQCWYYQDNFIP